MPPRLTLHAGPRATEDWLLGRLDHALAKGPEDIAALAAPVRVIVPSRSLRDHFSSALLRHRGAAVAGIVIQTHQALAREVVERHGERSEAGDDLLALLTRRWARRQPAFSTLEALRDGYALIAGSVRDLLDAGLEAAHGPAVAELLQAEDLDRPRRERVLATVEVALGVQRALEALGRPDRTGLLRQAQAVLDQHGPAALPTRALFVHGFSDATGAVSDWLEASLRTFGGEVALDQPARPGTSEHGVEHRPRETAFSAALRLRLSQVAVPEHAEVAEPPNARIRLRRVRGTAAEARAAAEAVAEALDDGVQPERVALVCRDLAPQARRLRQALHDLGLPFSAPAAVGPLEPAWRPVIAFVELLRRGDDAAIERWVELFAGWSTPQGESATGPASDAPEATRDDIDSDPLERHQRSNPVNVASSRAAATAAAERLARAGATRCRHLRRLPAMPVELAHGLEAGRRVVEAIADWRRRPRGAWAAHRATLETLVDGLAWPDGDPARPRIHKLLDRIEALVGSLPVDADEVVDLLEARLASISRGAVGGLGGGVAVLGVTEARGRTFERLVIFGLERDVFPRTVREDPLLPDRLRRTLRTLLPDLPLKRRGVDEERHLFAQLLDAAPEVTLIYRHRDDRGDPVASSPLLEPLLAGGRLVPDDVEPCDHTVRDHLLRAARSRGREALTALLPIGLTKPESTNVVQGARGLAAARRAILDELDPEPGHEAGRATRRRLGPYFGFVGPLADDPENDPSIDREDAGDPRLRPPAITVLEQLASCPWQTFVQRLLAVAPPTDPLAGLPALDARLVGSLVHAVLERIARHEPSWPTDDRLEQWAHEESEHLLTREGLGLVGLGRAAARRALPFLRAAAQSWPDAPAVHGVEASETISVPVGDTRRAVRLRVDRVDRLPDRWRATDYKTGRPPADATEPSRRRRVLLDETAAGRRLQAAAYLYLRPPEAPDVVEGRLLFLRPDLDPAQRSWSLASHDTEARSRFERTLTQLFAAWEHGVFFPRLVEADDDVEPMACRRCTVAEACLRRDSGSRLRLRAWAEAGGTPAGDDPLTDAVLAVWRLGLGEGADE